LAELCRNADRLVAEGADVLELSAPERGDPTWAVSALVTAVPVPLGVVTGRSAVARAACAAGAVLASDPTGFADPDFLPSVADAGASVVAPDLNRARRAEAAGIPPHRVVLELPSASAAALATAPMRHATGLGYPVLLSTVHLGDRRAEAWAAAALALSRGCRLVRTVDVRGARRVCDVLAAILEAG
jgi:dihydropteroate synthase